MTEVHREIMNRYELAGIFSNRWAGSGMCYCEHCARDFAGATGLELPRTKDARDPARREYLEWRQQRLFGIAELWDTEIRKINPTARYIPNSGGGALSDLDMSKLSDLTDIHILANWDRLEIDAAPDQLVQVPPGLSAAAAIEIIALLMRQHPSLAPRLAPAGPSPNEPFADENVADVPAVDTHARKCAAIAVRALAQDLDALTLQQLRQSVFRTLRQIAFIGTLPLDLRRIDVEDADRLRFLRHAEPQGIPVPDADFGRFARQDAKHDGDDDVAAHCSVRAFAVGMTLVTIFRFVGTRNATIGFNRQEHGLY
jgi:hypothetical protein